MVLTVLRGVLSTLVQYNTFDSKKVNIALRPSDLNKHSFSLDISDLTSVPSKFSPPAKMPEIV